jgi:hypothetical protein|tara:strand:- start:1024 stop:1608 length:585 start_codon:yes stop_codon:yes gene_type:complete
MTTRLKLLSALLCVSIVYAVYDYIDRNSVENTTRVKKKKNRRARTAGVSASSAKVRKMYSKASNTKKTQQKTQENKVVVSTDDFTTISDEYNSLDGWARNPFVEVYEPKPIASVKKEKIIEQAVQVIEKPLEINSLDQLKIETAVRMGQKAFVTINGETFEEGDLINDALIEKIENEKVTFKIGKTRVIKDIGT